MRFVRTKIGDFGCKLSKSDDSGGLSFGVACCQEPDSLPDNSGGTPSEMTNETFELSLGIAIEPRLYSQWHRFIVLQWAPCKTYAIIRGHGHVKVGPWERPREGSSGNLLGLVCSVPE